MRILITGASGFVAAHLLKELEPTRHTVILTSRRPFQAAFRTKKINSLLCDLTQKAPIQKIVKRARPDTVVHLAALPHVGKSWTDPGALIHSNLIATKNLCEALQGRSVHFLLVSSAMVYGTSAATTTRLDENSPTRPVSPYGFSKLAAETLARSYENRRFRVTVVRPFNHTGPGQTQDFVCPAFAERIRKTPSGGAISVGDLQTRRDFTDVRDVARAYRLIVEKKPAEKLFVLGSGKSVSIRTILETLIRISGKKIKTRKDSKLLQKNDVKTLVANPRLLEEIVGWTPRLKLTQTLSDLYFESTSSK